MSRFKKIAVGTAVALGVVGAAYFWLLKDTSIPQQGRFEVDMAQVRALADAGGERPSEIRVETIMTSSMPFALLVAGEPWDRREMAMMSYQVVWPDRTLIIDAAVDESLAKALRATKFDREAYARMAKGLEEAGDIVLTHEHVDHIGGIANAADIEKLLPALRMTREQAEHPEHMNPAKFSGDALKNYVPLSYEKYAAAAPGVVLIKAPGHTPGSQMVYVHLADDREFLFIGDIAWQMKSLETLHTRPRLIGQFYLGEDRDGVIRQLIEIKRIAAASPNMKLIAGHDPDVIAKLTADNHLVPQFKTAEAPRR